MSASSQRQAIGGYFNTQWANATPIAWPNFPMTPPVNASWVRFTIRNADSSLVELGNPRNQTRTTGVVIIQVYTPLDKGDGAALTLADQVAAKFIGVRIAAGADGDVRFRSPIIQPVGPDQGGREGSSYYQVNVSIPFWHDSV